MLWPVARAEGQSHSRVSAEWAAAWRADLDSLAIALPEHHADLYHSVSPERFRAALDSLRASIPQMAHHEIVVELARIVALVGDGHTRLTLPLDSAAGFFLGHSGTPPPKVPGLVFRHYPIRLHLYEDGLYVRRVARRYASAAGLRVVGIGEMTADEAMAAVEPTVERDNRYQVKHLLPGRLVIPEILHARGVIPDLESARFELEDGRGRRVSLDLAPVPPGRVVDWVDARRTDEPPLYLRHPDERHWFEYLVSERTLYVRYREVLDEEEGEAIHEFAERLFRFLEERPVERLILDIRGNPGGNGGLNRPLVHGIIRSRELWEPGRLFALIDRGTFSAALMFAAALEDHTPVVFVGEPTGARPNGYGDSRKLELPNSGITIRASTLYWQLTDPRDDRAAIEPHLPVGLRAVDYRNDQDPVLETVLALDDGEGAPTGRWTGTWGIERARYELGLRIRHDDAGWHASFDLPVLELDDVELQDVSFSDRRLRFTWYSPQGPFTCEAWVARDWIVGLAQHRSRKFPFILRRERVGAAPETGPDSR